MVETDPIGFVSVNDADGGTDNTIAVTVTSANVTDQDFVDSPAPGALTGVVFDDLNNNGQLDAGEPGIPGVTVALSTGPTTLTDASGVYTFTNLTPGNYTITETDLAGYISTGDVDGANDNKIVATVNAGQTTTDQDFGDTQLGVITGTVWNDTNLDGIMDGGEGFLPGVQVCAVPTGSGVPLCATTDANGDYTIPNVPPGGYIVTETDPAGYVSTTPNSVPVTVPSGGTETIDYGDVLPNPALGSISGTVCENVNGNGVCEANEPPLPGVTVELWLVGGGAALYTTTTDANGDYAFPNLPSGSYQVKEVNPPNYTSVNDADGNATPDVISPIVIAGNAVTDQDFIDAPTPGSISGKVCNDLNRDGVCGGGEGPLDGVTVKVYDSGGNLVDTQTTAGGNYIFNNLPPGTYTVVETDPANYQSTGDVYGANDNVIVATVPAGTAVSGQNFADAQKPGAITGVVYDDLNGDGNYDPGEPGLPNVQVCLTPPSGPQVCQTTNAGGQYAFTDLTPGNYTVTETDPAGYLSTGDADGSANGNNTIAPITVAAGQTVVERNFFDKLGTTGYLLTKTLNSQESVRINKEISFTIRITNTGQTPITVLPLRDTYSTTFLSYGYGTPVKFAEPASANTDNDGILDWPDLTVSLGKDLGPTESFSVTVYFTAIKDTTGLANNSTINTAAVHDAFAGATPLPSDTASASVQVFLPTGVGVSDFGGVRQGSEVHLTWRTAEEANLAGFNVLRKTGDGEFVVLNSELLFAQNAGANQGATYSFVDAGAPADGATYVLELVKLDGSVEAHAPIAVQP